MQNIFLHEKLLAFIFLVAVVGFVIFLSFSPGKNPFQRPAPSPTQLPNLQVTPIPTTLNISQVSPTDSSMNNSVTAPVSITFSRPVMGYERGGIVLTTTPNIPGVTSWSTDNQTLTLQPNTPLLPSQTYTVSLSYLGNSFQSSFTTAPIESLSQEDQQALQSQADKQYAQKDKNTRDLYPWYDQLPLMDSRYFVYFDMQAKQFVAIVYTSSNPGLTIDSVKSEITNRLTGLGIDTTQYTISWTTQ